MGYAPSQSALFFILLLNFSYPLDYDQYIWIHLWHRLHLNSVPICTIYVILLSYFLFPPSIPFSSIFILLHYFLSPSPRSPPRFPTLPATMVRLTPTTWPERRCTRSPRHWSWRTSSERCRRSSDSWMSSACPSWNRRSTPTRQNGWYSLRLR